MDADYIRICPTCDAENSPHVMRCACGALLAGVDLVDRKSTQPASSTSVSKISLSIVSPDQANHRAESVICSFEDCGQANPAGTVNCLYCNRLLPTSGVLTKQGQLQSLLTLPTTLKDRYRIVSPLPTQGAEAELLLVEEIGSDSLLPAQRVAKIYRHGILPRPDVQERIARVHSDHRVEVLEAGISDGYAFELMEYCTLGSLRHFMHDGPMQEAMLLDLIRELSMAIAGVHAVGLLHRDLKPENILVRRLHPLDLILTDFGTSSILDATQRFTGTARTLPYASPESLSGVIDGEADYWALGIIILEAFTGKHPFAGLSEAVILYQLTTRNLDLAGITDRNVRKLLRGLLLRNPSQRWGNAEIVRWLAHDATLAEPAEEGLAANFTEPYHIANDLCHTKEQLAVALARHWREGASDIVNGQLQSWFTKVQKDQNVVRLLVELRYEKSLPVDSQLLKLILHLTPGIPPVWRGESIELPAILKHANLALKSDVDAEDWLDKLRQYRVLEAYASAGNQEAANIVEKWGRACDQFEAAWNKAVSLLKAKTPAPGSHEFVNIDKLLYGNDELQPPPMASMHARLLAIAYDAQWAERLRKRVAAEMNMLMINCPWLLELGDIQTMDAASLLVVESLLPEARKIAERQTKADECRRVIAIEECTKMHSDVMEAVANICSLAAGNLLSVEATDQLLIAVDKYLELVATIKNSGRADLDWQSMKRTTLQSTKEMGRMQDAVYALTERRAVNAGWMNQQVFSFVVFVLILSRLFVGGRTIALLALLVTAFVVWRLLPNYFLIKQIREIARRVSRSTNHTSSV